MFASSHHLRTSHGIVSAAWFLLVVVGGYWFSRRYASTGSISLIEAWWSVVWAFVCLLALRFLTRSIGDEIVRRRSGRNGQGRTVAMDAVWGSLTYVITCGSYLALGLFAMSISPETRHRFSFPITITLLFLPGIVLTIDLIRREFIPAALRREYREEQEAKALAIRLEENTAAVTENTAAVAEQTYSLNNGPLLATLAHTEALLANTAGMAAQNTAADVREDAAVAREAAAVERHEDTTNGGK